MVSMCFLCHQNETDGGRVLCDQCLAVELAAAVRKGHVGEGFLDGTGGRHPMDYDTFEALAVHGDLAVNFLGLAGTTREEALRLAHGDDEQAQVARQLLTMQELLIGMLQLAFPKQIALALIWNTADEATFRAASAWLVDQFRWRIDDPRVEAAVRARAWETGRSRFAVKRDLLVSALLVVREQMSAPQLVRFGRHWVKDGAGARAQLTPAADLRWLYLWRWIHTRACRLAEADLLCETVPLPESDDVHADVDALRDTLTRLEVTGRDQEIVLLKAAGLNARKIAAQLGMKPGTVRVSLHRLRRHREVLARIEAADMSRRDTM